MPNILFNGKIYTALFYAKKTAGLNIFFVVSLIWVSRFSHNLCRGEKFYFKIFFFWAKKRKSFQQLCEYGEYFYSGRVQQFWYAILGAWQLHLYTSTFIFDMLLVNATGSKLDKVWWLNASIFSVHMYCTLRSDTSAEYNAWRNYVPV
jgi:hypothetical protein